MHELITCPMTLLHTLFKNLPLKDKPFEHELLNLSTWPHIVCLAINTVLSFTATQCQKIGFTLKVSRMMVDLVIGFIFLRLPQKH